MDNNSLRTSFEQLLLSSSSSSKNDTHNTMIYYLLPEMVKKRCLELKRISIQQENLDLKYKLERQAIYRKYSTNFIKQQKSNIYSSFNDDNNLSSSSQSTKLNFFPLSPFEKNPLNRIYEKANDIKLIAKSNPEWLLEESVSLDFNLYRSKPMKKVLTNCETKCNEILTHLANIDWELNEYEKSMLSYHNEMINIMKSYNLELTLLYEERSFIVNGEDKKLLYYHDNSRREHENSENSSCSTSSSSSSISFSYLNDDSCNDNNNQEFHLREQDISIDPTISSKIKDLNCSIFNNYNEEFVNIEIKCENNNDEKEKILSKLIKGVPGFWFHSLTIALKSLNLNTEFDREILKYLIDIRYYYDIDQDKSNLIHRNSEEGEEEEDETLTIKTTTLNSDFRIQKLMFYFNENPYFTNRILTKTYHIDKSRRNGEKMFDGFWIRKVDGSKINWLLKPNDDDDNFCYSKGGDNLTINNSKRTKNDLSFFDFFENDGFRNKTDRKVKRFFKGKEFNVELDYDVFVRFRDFIAPHAIVAYSRGSLNSFDCSIENNQQQQQQKSSKLTQKMYYLKSLFN